jgi:hypothetical protein
VAPEEDISRQPVVQVEITSLILADSPRLSGLNLEHVEALTATQNPIPPIVVHRRTMRVIDGAHRLEAALRRGERTIAAQFFDGGEAEAFVLAVKLNISHGLPLALADRKRAAERIMGTHSHWSDRRVASVTGVSPGTVAEVRKRIGDETLRLGSRVGQDGRVRPLDGSAGRRMAGQLMREKPHLSLRQVAKAAAISPETARDVRNRLLSGEDPVPARRRRGEPAAAQEEASADGMPAANVGMPAAHAGMPSAHAAMPATGVGTPATSPEMTLGRGADVGSLALARLPGRPRRGPMLDRTAVLNRLKADPALRYTDTGRNLLRLLTLHTFWTEEWEAIINHLPPHCSRLIADLAREFADQWTDFARRAAKDVAHAS